MRVDGRPEPARRLLAAGERVTLDRPPFAGLAKADPAVPILFEDEDMIVVDKPAGLVVHPAGPHRADTLVQRLWPRLASGWSDSATERPGVVHRLDRGTSGVLVLAKTPEAAARISAQFAARTVEKVYWAWVEGRVETEGGRIRSHVGRSRRAPHRMTTSVPGRWSETDFKVLRRGSDRSLLELRPRTGRTHQLRVHLSALGHPILGDRTYGAAAGTGRPLLHAQRLTLAHPRTGARLTFSAPLPSDFAG